MQNFRMYMCDECGYAREKPGICMFCQTPLTAYTKDSQAEYQVNMEEPMRLMHEYKWYL